MNQDNVGLPYFGYPNLRTTIIPITVPTGSTAGKKVDIDGSKSGLPKGAKIVGLSLIDYVASGTTLDNADNVADLADATIINGGVIFLCNNTSFLHKMPLSDLVKRQADEPFLRFPLPVNIDFIDKKSYVILTASNANLTTNIGRVIGLVVRYLDPNCDV